MYKKIIFVGYLFFGLLQYAAANKKIKIAISKGESTDSSYQYYGKWIRHFAPEIEIVDLIEKSPQEAIEILKTCQGLILSGGPDADPARYGKAEEISKCKVDSVRDSLEFALIDVAFQENIPTLAICRGEQLVNIAFGGTLIVDIPTDTQSTVIHRAAKGSSAAHPVVLEKNTRLYQLAKNQDTLIVNSFHHQAVDELAPVFTASSRSLDGLIESYEFKEKTNRAWFLAVQWHPERLDQDDALAKAMALDFIKSVKKQSKKQITKRNESI